MLPFSPRCGCGLICRPVAAPADDHGRSGHSSLQGPPVARPPPVTGALQVIEARLARAGCLVGAVQAPIWVVRRGSRDVSGILLSRAGGGRWRIQLGVSSVAGQTPYDPDESFWSARVARGNDVGTGTVLCAEVPDECAGKSLSPGSGLICAESCRRVVRRPARAAGGDDRKAVVAAVLTGLVDDGPACCEGVAQRMVGVDHGGRHRLPSPVMRVDVLRRRGATDPTRIGPGQRWMGCGQRVGTTGARRGRLRLPASWPSVTDAVPQERGG